MLKAVSCDKFIENGQPRGKIEFKKGLNIIRGGVRGTNSIGKSTFLLILDFVFGGDDYISIATDAQNNVHEHIIKFEFEFDGDSFYFYRSTGDYQNIYLCDVEYRPEAKWTSDAYTEWLCEKYNLTLPDLTFRGAESRFIRVANRENSDARKPLASAKHEPEKQAIAGMLKLFDMYASVSERQTAYNTAKEEEKTFKNAQKYNYISVASNITEVKKNVERITELDKELTELSEKNSQGLLELTSLQKKQLRELTDKCSALIIQEADINTQLRAIRKNKDAGKKKFQADYDELIEFFPDVNIDRLYTVEGFHREITGVLKSEFRETEEKLELMNKLLRAEIEKLEKEMRSIAEIPTVSEAIITEYTRKDRERETLKKANEAFYHNDELHEVTLEQESQLNNITMSQVMRAQSDINENMKRLNDYVCGKGAKIKTPVLNVTDARHYELYTPDDTGTGTSYKGLILFDLACLELTRLPFIIHDSYLFDHIEYDRVSKIIELYDQYANKQIFVSLDREGNYSAEAQEIIKNRERLRLERGGRELFGWSWSKED